MNGRKRAVNNSFKGSKVRKSHRDYLKQSYPSTRINIVNEAAYYKKSEPGKITIKIGIAAYQAGFGADISVGIGSVGGSFSYGLFPKGEWNGLTSYFVQGLDNRKTDGKKHEKEISDVISAVYPP